MRSSLFLIAFLACLTGVAQSSEGVREDLVKCITALNEAPNYSWSTTVKVPEGTRFAPGPSTGKILKNGEVYATSTRGQNTTKIVKLGEKAAVTNQDGEWQSLAEIEAGGGFGRLTVNLVRDLTPPATEALELIKGMETIEKHGNEYSGELTEKAAIELASASSGFRRRGASNVVFAKSTVSFTVDHGVLKKMQQTLDASVDFNGTEFIVERVTTTNIDQVGSTTIEIPEGARAKLE